MAIDTNVLLSGLLWRGPPHSLIEALRDGTLRLISSPAQIAEFSDVIHRPKFRLILDRSGKTAEEIIAELRILADVIDPPPLPEPVSRDPDDDGLLALAKAGQADLIISGDRDLLSLGSFAGVPILDASSAVARVSGQR